MNYEDCMKLDNYGDRLKYLSLADTKHQSPRSISNTFYKSSAWKKCRDDIIRRDLGCDLADPNVSIPGPILVHHIIPLVEEDFEEWNTEKLFNPNNLITVSIDTHNKIHYGSKIEEIKERRPNDTKLW